LGYHVIYRSHVDAQYLMAMDMGQDFTTKWDNHTYRYN
jgi:hypothetical protein